MKNLFCISLFLFFSLASQAQCECTDCPITIINEATVSSFMDIDGAANNDLGSSDQQVCMICLDLTQDAMEELDIVITAPNGSSVALTVNDNIGFGVNIFFEICFVSCDLSASPDAGFDAVFDTSNDWQDNTTYTGTYYPQAGCLEDLTGPVNGEWQLDITDVLFLEDGELFDWYMVFADGTGIGCENEGECGVVNSCIAEGGELEVDDLSLCEGDPDLDINVDPSFPAGNEPPASEYDYTYIISDANTGVILDITPSTDLTSFAPGTYEICGLSYLIDDAGDIPSADGSLTINDIQDDIDDDVYCADISDDCFEVVILSNPPFPDFQGPPTVCIGDLVQFEVLNYDPDYTYLFSIVGSFSTFIVTDGVVEFSLLSGPAEICVSIEDSCTDTEVCLTIDIAGALDPFEILGNLNPCPGSIETYDFLPIPDSGDSYEVTLTAGTILSQTDTSVEIEWPSTDGVEELCIELMDPACDADPFCVDIDIEFGFELPTDLNTPDELCLESVGTSFIPSDTDILNYTWTLTNLDLISGQGTEVIEYEGIALGFAEVCLEIETICGIQGPVCEALEILEIPEPEITEIDPSCLLVIDLESTADAANSIEWTLLSGPGTVGFDPADEANTTATFSDPGTYTLLLTEANGICEGMEEIEITILDNLIPLEILGNLNPCPGSTETYDFLPIPDLGESYELTLTAGTILSQTDSSIEIEWPLTESIEELCIELISPSCDSDPFCVDIDIEIDYTLPTVLNTPDEICLGNLGGSSIPFDADVVNYSWTLSNLDLLSGQGTEEIEYEGISLGFAEVCLEIETTCGMQGPICEEIEILETPEPEITEVDPSCILLIDLESTADLSNNIEWSLISGPGTVNFNPIDEPNSTATFSEFGTYSILLTETNGICQAIEEIEITILDDLEIIDLSLDCNLNNEYLVSFEIVTGVEPYSVNGNALVGSVFESDPINSGEDYFFEILDDLGCSTILEGNFDCPCLSDAGSMPLDLIESCILADDIVIVEWNIDGVLDNNDLGTYILHDNQFDELGQIIAINEFGEFEYSTDMIPGQTYYISYVVGDELSGMVDLDDLCLSVSIGQPIVFYNPTVLDFVVASETCEMSILIDGVIPVDISDILWNQIAGPGSSSFNTNSSLPTTITVSEQGVYTYEVEVLNSACTSYQVFEVNFLSPPQIINPVEECTGSSDFYTISVEVQGGEAPYQSNIPGAFANNIFTSEPIPSGEPYSLIITDNFGCASIAFDGVKLCDCSSDAGVLNGTPITLCEGDILVFDPIENEVLDPNDFGQYYLYFNDQFGNQILLDSSTTPMFQFQNTFSLDVPYLISFFVANELNNTLDFTDPCLDISNSFTATWNAYPIVEAGDDQEICLDEVALIASPVGGQWNIISSPTGAVAELNNENDNNAILSLDTPGAYVLEWSSTNGQCEANDQVTVIRNIIPEVANLTTTCSADLETFQLDFDVSGGGPFMVNGELVIDAYTSDGLDNDIANVFFIENALGCSTTVLIDPVNCECQNDAGTVVNNSFSLCTDELLNPAISNGDYLLEQGDSLMYIIHNGTATEIGDILVSSFGEEIMFDDVFETNTSYFLTAVVGAFLNGTIDLNDPCIKFSESVPVEWLEDNDIIFVGMLEGCIGDIVDAEIQVTGSLPVELTISNDQGLVEVISIQNASEIISFEVMDAFQEWTITDVVGDCIDEITSDLVVIGQEPLAFNLSQDLETCNGTSFVSTIDLSSIIDIDVSLGEWISTEIPIVDGVADFTTLDAGEYNLEFTTVGLEGLCAGSASSTVITVIECVCPIFINDDVMLCNNQDLFDLSILDTQGYEGTWSIENNASLNSPPVIQSTDLNPGGATGGLYALLYTITQSDYPEECDNLIVINLVIEEENKTGFQDEPAIYCQDDLLEINLFDLLEGEDAGGVWTYEGEAISEIQNTGDLVLGVNEFFYAFANEATLCPENQSSVIVDIKTVPIFQAVGENVSCFGEADGELLITVEDVQGSIEPVSCYVNDILQEEGKVLTDLSPGVYTIYVENEFCKSAIQEVTIEEPDPVIVSLGDDREILLDEVIVIEAITNILDSDVDSITWFDLAEILQVDEFELMATFDSDVIINVEIIDINDCVAFDQISISVLTVKESIYLPNIFNPESQMGNETFGIMNPEIVDVLNTFNIYDRWGNLVFSQDAITGIQDLPRWDGSYNGLPAEMGVYVYFFEVTLNSGETEIYAGDVTLMR